ncbi:MAG: DUF4276 family protein [Verrucomicrobiales bacterium]
MDRLLIHVEGETEETFVNELLAPHLYGCGFVSVSARLLGNARRRDRRGGIQGWPPSKKDILRHLREDPNRSCTMMVDFYALPQSGSGAWPGRAEAASLPFSQKAAAVETRIFASLREDLGGDLSARRFVPFVMMHEFEALLFSDCARFGQGIGRPELAADFQAIRDHFESPEEINDSPITAPSKRVLDLVPGYQKPLLGNLAALEIGLGAICAACPHFDGWVRQLEGLAR